MLSLSCVRARVVSLRREHLRISQADPGQMRHLSTPTSGAPSFWDAISSRASKFCTVDVSVSTAHVKSRRYSAAILSEIALIGASRPASSKVASSRVSAGFVRRWISANTGGVK